MISGQPFLLQNSHTFRKFKEVWQQSAFFLQSQEDRIVDRGNRLYIRERAR
jgi:hypothetical protein